MSTGIYIHIPFCTQKCTYCDFLSSSLMVKDRRSIQKELTGYVGGLLEEMKAARLGGLVDTVYIGGGTPTALLSNLLCEILETVKDFPLISDAEITVEANPGTLNPKYLADIIECGANRLSLGLQATQPRLLNMLGRVHTKKDFLDNFHAARRAGFKNINIDLMFALPGQSLDDWKETLTLVLNMSPEHISAYSLTPAEGTPLWEQIKSGQAILPDDGTDRDMYHLTRRMLAEAGYIHYEISNFAKPGFESRHNYNCWTMRPYRGFGLGAHSFDGKSRWHNTEDMSEYLSGSQRAAEYLRKNFQHLTPSGLMSETMIMGLRLIEGISENAFAEAFEKSPTEQYAEAIPKLISDGLLSRQNGCLALTQKGMDLANRVFEAFV